jgi:hypothetical protein
MKFAPKIKIINIRLFILGKPPSLRFFIFISIDKIEFVSEVMIQPNHNNQHDLRI